MTAAVRIPSPAYPESQFTTSADQQSRMSELAVAPKRHRGALISYALVAAVLYLGWRGRVEQYLTAESGLGYALGIVGGSLMLLLLLYPLRKRVRFMRWLGATKHWFRLHMILGVVGPVLILFHANFELGSLNSNVALISMLLVAGSGLVGRYFYSRIHYGLYGRKMSLVELRQITVATDHRLGAVLSFVPDVQRRLHALETAVLTPPATVLHSIVRILFMGLRTRWAHFASRGRIRRALRKEARRAGWSRAERKQHVLDAIDYLDVYLETVRTVSSFGFYERLFALWHVLHLPLFIILVFTGVVHVLAVHMY